MSIASLTPERALELLREVVAEYGDEYVYPVRAVRDVPGCTYHRDGKPSCIVGQVLFKAGMSPAELQALDTSGDNTNISSLVNREALVLPERVARLLASAQYTQDMGSTWGAALLAATEEYDTQIAEG